MTTTAISIEKIATGTVIDVPGFGSAEVYGLQFEGDSYSVTYCTNDAGGWDSLDITTINAGELVECLNGRTYLRADKDISLEEWQAKGDAISAATDVLLGKINAAQGHVCQPVDDALLTGSVAAAIGVPALQAAE